MKLARLYGGNEIGVSPRFLTLVAVVTLFLLLPLLGACVSEEGPDGSGQDAGDRSTVSLRDRLHGVGGDQTTETPEGSSSSPLLPTPEGPPCLQRKPNPNAVIPPTQTSADTDKQALLAIFNATEGETWDTAGRRSSPMPTTIPAPTTPPTKSPDPQPTPTPAPVMGTVSGNWGGHAPIGEWAGVATNSQGRVVALQLSGLNGELPPELGNLTSLRGLTISSSHLTGGLPPELENLKSLESLNIQGNQSTEGLPSELGNLSNLEMLHLRGNQLCGEIPPELEGLTGLRSLDLGYNQLTGPLPAALARLTKLETLNLADNRLTGEVPSWLAGLTELTTLDLSNNQLAGELPPDLEQVALAAHREYRVTLNLDGNQLSGCQSDFLRDEAPGSIPSLPVCSPENHAGDTEALIALHQAWGKPNLRNWLSREPIGEWEGVSVGFDGRVAALSLSRGLTGPLPSELGHLTGLRVLVLEGGLTGPLPPELGNLTGLRVLVLEGGLTGELPAELGNLTSLRGMRISTGEAGGLKCSPDANRQKGTFLAGVCELETVGVASVSAGDYHTCGVRANGAVDCWGGSGTSGHTTPPEGEFASVSAGGIHTCGVRTNGAVACWGFNSNGQSTPPGGEFASVSAGGIHTCGVRTNGAVACWGSNNTWSPGVPTHYIGQSTPPEGEFASVSAGEEHTCGVRTDGAVACWGDGSNGKSTPPEGKFASVSAGEEHTCGVKRDGSAVCWGSYRYSDDGGWNRAKAGVPEGKFTSVSAGTNHTCGVRADGAVACSGMDGLTTPPEGEFASVSAGKEHTCGVRADGAVACWGSDRNNHGQATPPGKFASSISMEDGAVCVVNGGARTCLTLDESGSESRAALAPTPMPVRAAPSPVPAPRPTSTPTLPRRGPTPEPSPCDGIGDRYNWTERDCAVALGIIRDRNGLSAIHVATDTHTDWEAIVAKFNEGRSPDHASYCYFPADYSLPLDRWCGVTTDLNGRVWSLDLGGIGAVDGEGWGIGLNGTIPSALAGLDALWKLDLSDGKVCGFFGCRGGLTGRIPDELGLLPELASVNLSGNELEGSIYGMSCLPRLETLNVSNNRFESGATKFLANPCNVENADLKTEIQPGRNPWNREPKKVRETISDDDEVITIQRGFLDLTTSTASQLGVPTDVQSWAEDYLKGQSAELIAYGRHVNFRNRGAAFVVRFSGELAKAYTKVVPVVGWVSFGADTAFTLYDVTRATVELLEGVREAREVQSNTFLGIYALCELEWGWATGQRPPNAEEILRDRCQ